MGVGVCAGVCVLVFALVCHAGPPHPWSSSSPPACTFKNAHRVQSKRHRVHRHHDHKCYDIRAWCMYTRQRSHGGFSVPHRTARRQKMTVTREDKIKRREWSREKMKDKRREHQDKRMEKREDERQENRRSREERRDERR